jgi:hypothetical protein
MHGAQNAFPVHDNLIALLRNSILVDGGIVREGLCIVEGDTDPAKKNPRWTQSPANLSPLQFPANREKYREFLSLTKLPLG